MQTPPASCIIFSRKSHALIFGFLVAHFSFFKLTQRVHLLRVRLVELGRLNKARGLLSFMIASINGANWLWSAIFQVCPTDYGHRIVHIASVIWLDDGGKRWRRTWYRLLHKWHVRNVRARFRWMTLCLHNKSKQKSSIPEWNSLDARNDSARSTILIQVQPMLWEMEFVRSKCSTSDHTSRFQWSLVWLLCESDYHLFAYEYSGTHCSFNGWRSWRCFSWSFTAYSLFNFPSALVLSSNFPIHTFYRDFGMLKSNNCHV